MCKNGISAPEAGSGMKGDHPISSRLARLLLTIALAGSWTVGTASARHSRVDPAAAAEQAPPAGENPAGPAGLEGALAAVRERIAGLPARPCGLRAPWNDYLQIFDDRITDLDGASEGAEVSRAARGIDDLDRLVSAYEFMNEEACSLYDENLGERQRLERIRERVRAGLAEAVWDIRGNAFPFAAADEEFGAFYRSRHIWPVPGDSHWGSAGEMLVSRHGNATDRTAWEFMRARTSVRDGVVTVDTRSGNMDVATRFSTGGSFLVRNRLRYEAWEDYPGGFRIETPRRTRMCSGRSSTRDCWGNTPELMRRRTPRYLLSRVFLHGMAAALQERVTAACTATIRDRAAMLGAVYDHRPADPRDRALYDFAAEEFLAAVERSGVRPCAVDGAAIMTGLAETAAASARAVDGTAIDELRIRQRQLELQGVLNALGLRLVDAYRIGGTP